ncbi:MAG: hypothetical protein QW483_02865, partial [Nanopusillaceae archaeon]
AMFGVNTYLEEKREYGLELLEDFKNYNYFQFYTYVLSDYEVRRIFFETLYKEILNKSIVDGVLDPIIYNSLLFNNSTINMYVPNCKNIFEFVVDKYIDPAENKYDIVLYFPCFELLPITDFNLTLNKSFIDTLRSNYLYSNIFEEHAKAIYYYTNLTINIKQKEFNVEEDDILFKQNIEYFYKGKKEKITRYFNISLSYSLIPNIFLYIKLFTEDYIDILNDLLEKIENNDVYNISKLKDYIDGSFSISHEGREFIILYKNHLKKSERLNFVKSIYNLSQVTQSIYYKYQEVYLCDQLEVYSGSPSYQLKYENISGCHVAKTPESLRIDKRYEYLVETCLYDNYYHKSESLDETLARICFYKREPYFMNVHKLDKFPEAIVSPFYGDVFYVENSVNQIKNSYIIKSDGFYLWPIKEIPWYKIKIVGRYVPILCELGYQYIDGPYCYANITMCEDKRQELLLNYTDLEDPSIFISKCKGIIKKSNGLSVEYCVYVGRYAKRFIIADDLVCENKSMNRIYFGIYVI